MRIWSAGWCAAAVAAMLSVAYSQPPVDLPQPSWSSEHVALPASPCIAPLPWVPSPAGPGAWLIGPDIDAASTSACALGARTFFATPNGVMYRDADGPVCLVPEIFGRDVRIIGSAAARVWVQDLTAGSVLSLHPQTLQVDARIAGVQGRCIAADAAAIWCLAPPTPARAGRGSAHLEETAQALHAPSDHGGRRLRFLAQALIEYAHDGTERRRFSADGTLLPQGTLVEVSVDADAVWTVMYPLGMRCACGRAHERAPEIWRIDRTSGAARKVVTADKGSYAFASHPDQVIWVEPPAPQDAMLRRAGASAAAPRLCILQKGTQRVTHPPRLPQKYLRGVYAVQDGKIWCAIRGDYDGEMVRAPEVAVFALDTGRRIHREEAGTPPVETRDEARDDGAAPGYPGRPQRGTGGYRALGGTPTCAWVRGPDARLYEIPDTGEMLVRDLSSLPSLSDDSDYYRMLMPSPLPTAFTSGLLLLAGMQPMDAGMRLKLAHIAPGAQQATCYTTGEMLPLAASDRRLWCWNTDGLVTCGRAMRPALLPYPVQRSEHEDDAPPGTSVAVEDDLYVYGPRMAYVASGRTGEVRVLASRERHLPKEWRPLPAICGFATPEGDIVFYLSDGPHMYAGYPPEAYAAVAAAEGTPRGRAAFCTYHPATGAWTVHPDPHPKHGTILQTARGAFLLAPDETTLYRGTATGWVPAGTLPFRPSLGGRYAATTDYLYLDAPIGLYRVRWAALLTGKEAR